MSLRIYSTVGVHLQSTDPSAKAHLFAFEYSAAIVMRASTDRTLSDSDVSSLRELSAPQGANGS